LRVIARRFDPVNLGHVERRRASRRRDHDVLVARRARRRTQPFHQALHRGGEARLADGLHEVVERFGFECAKGELIVGRKKHHLRHPLYGSAANHFEAVYARHLNVEEDHVGRQRVQRRERLRAVAAFPGDGKLRKRRQQLSHAPARGGLVIDNQDSPLNLLHGWTTGLDYGIIS
jgi:hypothetical protein